MSRDYYSVDLPRTSTPFQLKEAIDEAIVSYSSETEQDIVPFPSKRKTVVPKPSKESRLSALSRHNSAAKRSAKVETRPRLETIESFVEKPALTSHETKVPPRNEVTAKGDKKEREKEDELRAKEGEAIGVTYGLSELSREEFTSYTVWNASYSNMRVCPVNLTGGNYYYVENRALIPNRPGVTLHLGTDKKAPTIAAAHLDYFSGKNVMGLGDPERAPSLVRWEKLTKDSFWTHMRYSFSFEWEDGEVRKYEWHRAKSMYWIQDQGDWVLVEEGKHDVMAQYKGKDFAQVQKQRGSLEIRKIDKERAFAWERYVILGWASIVELQRRRTRERRVQTLFGRIV